MSWPSGPSCKLQGLLSSQFLAYSEPADDYNHNEVSVIKILFLQTANYNVITLLTLETAASKHSEEHVHVLLPVGFHTFFIHNDPK